MDTFKKKYFQWMLFLLFFLALLGKAPNLKFYLNSPDHGYQISLGKQIMMGMFPFVDLFFHYGPLTAFTSALGLWISDSLIPETFICAIGYAAAIFFIYSILHHYVSTMAALLVSVMSFLFLARFYKWYYWLFPVFVLYCFHKLICSQYSYARKWLYIGGLASGIGGLYRFDLGIALLCFFSIALLSLYLQPFNVKVLRKQLTVYLLSFSLPFILWLTLLTLNGGTLHDYFAATFRVGQGIVQHWSLPIPSFDWSHPFSLQSGTALAFLLVPLTCGLCMVYGAFMRYRYSHQNTPKFHLMFASGLLGLGLFPQALHRSDLQHLLQILPPALIAGCLLVSDIWQRTKIGRRFFLKCLIILYLFAVGIAAWGTYDHAGKDLAKLEWPLLPRYQRLQKGLSSGLNHPIIRLISEVQNQTTLTDKVLVVPLACQLYYFVNRPMSGFINGFAPGVFDNNEWRHRNLEAIRNDPPIIVIAKDNFFDLPVSDWFRASQPELYSFLLTRYSEVVYQRDGWMLLKETSRF